MYIDDLGKPIKKYTSENGLAIAGCSIQDATELSAVRPMSCTNCCLYSTLRYNYVHPRHTIPLPLRCKAKTNAPERRINAGPQPLLLRRFRFRFLRKWWTIFLRLSRRSSRRSASFVFVHTTSLALIRIVVGFYSCVAF